MLKYRIVTALIMIPAVILCLFFSSPFVFALATLVVCMLGMWEWARLAGINSSVQRIAVAIVFGAALLWTLLQYSQPHTSLQIDFTVSAVRGWLWLSLLWWGIALLLVLSYPRSARLWRSFRWLKLLLGVFTLVPFYWGMLMLRAVSDEQQPYLGPLLLLYLMVLVWVTDTGAYAFGKRFGKNKLAPKVSPGKTWEGAIGGLVTSGLAAVLLAPYLPLAMSPTVLIGCSLIAVIASALGDLTESMFKREAGLKDSSQLIPGHGGILDRIDSLTAAVPVFACLVLLVAGV